MNPEGMAIELKGVSVFYEHKPVVREVDLAIPKGGFVGIVGPSGAGKTTLLKSVLGLVKPSSGSILVFGHEVRGRSIGHIGYVPQIDMIDWSFPITVEEVVAMGLRNQGSSIPWLQSDEKVKIAEILKKLGISHLSKKQIGLLSGGEQQRTFLARALISEPELLVLDEPTVGVDVKNQHAIMHMLYELNKQGKSILITTHDLNAVAAHLPYVICFNTRIIAEGKPREIFTSKNLKETFGAEVVVVSKGDFFFMSANTSITSEGTA